MSKGKKYWILITVFSLVAVLTTFWLLEVNNHDQVKGKIEFSDGSYIQYGASNEWRYGTMGVLFPRIKLNKVEKKSIRDNYKRPIW